MRKPNLLLLLLGAILVIYGAVCMSLVNPQLLDSCESLTFSGGEWIVVGTNVTLSVDNTSPYEGSGNLKVTANDTWNAMVVRRVTSYGAWWDLSKTPVLCFRVRVSDVSVPLYFHLVTAENEWTVYRYSAYNDQILTPNKWVTIEINLLTPNEGIPDLSVVRQFTWWLNPEGATTKLVNYVWEIDYIEVGASESGPPPPTPLSASISPSVLTVEPNQEATFTVSASGGSGTYQYTWYVDDELQTETSATFTYVPTTTGTYTIKCVVSDGTDTVSDTATLFVQEPGTDTYTLIIEATEGGTTNPPPGNYTKSTDETVVITQMADEGYSFDHWEVNGQVYTTENVTLVMTQNYVVKAVFVPSPTPPLSIEEPEVPPPQITLPAEEEIPYNLIVVGVGAGMIGLAFVFGDKND